MTACRICRTAPNSSRRWRNIGRKVYDMSKQLNALASELIGDGKRPNLYFVCNHNGDCIMVTQDAGAAYRAWRKLSEVYPLQECTLEDRLTGVICSVEPVSDEQGSRLQVWDESSRYMQRVSQ